MAHGTVSQRPPLRAETLHQGNSSLSPGPHLCEGQERHHRTGEGIGPRHAEVVDYQGQNTWSVDCENGRFASWEV